MISLLLSEEKYLEKLMFKYQFFGEKLCPLQRRKKILTLAKYDSRNINAAVRNSKNKIKN